MPVAWSDFQGANLAHALDLYERYRRDPSSVDDATRRLLDELPEPQPAAPPIDVESSRLQPPSDPIDALALLKRLTEVEAFETFLQRAFPGKTRFSIEGLDMLVPILDELVRGAADEGVRRVFIGMAHRGRLNVMAHVLGKPHERILSEFAEAAADADDLEGAEYTGDVKYHLGASRCLDGGEGEEVSLCVSMPPNPSHLEAINPVLEGMARAAGTNARSAGPGTFNPDLALPLLIHGDAAFCGQGVVAETLNLQRLRGYTTGGTIHVVANNQIGFTTDPEDVTSAHDTSGLARAFEVPIVRVDADDPEACIAAARMAIAYRREFRRDFLIDLVGYRRRGHNEGDEPAFTQPVMYSRIAKQPTVRAKWAQLLESRGILRAGEADERLRAAFDDLQTTLDAVKAGSAPVGPSSARASEPGAGLMNTGVPLKQLASLSAALRQTPAGFTLHPKLQRARARRADVWKTPERSVIDWAQAEELAFAAILADGTPIRLTGEDTERGTFSQRHAVLHDATTGARHTPLQALPMAKASFQVHNSPLSEMATLGFEYGYSVQAPRTLVIWEAQYGDFVNGGQTMIDEFVVSGRAKWRQTSSLVLLLPHGSEGQGPDHASARPERFLQLAADENLVLANCTTAAQYFHLLRRQAALLQGDPVPLIVLTPKSLLRHPLVMSRAVDLAEGAWQPVIDDVDRSASREKVRRLILCSGKIAVDLLSSKERDAAATTAVCRLEQLYPLPATEILEVVERYPSLREIVWVQEEPENAGAWAFVRPYLESLATKWRLLLLARPPSASPAEGSASKYAQAQARLVAQAFGKEVRSHVG